METIVGAPGTEKWAISVQFEFSFNLVSHQFDIQQEEICKTTDILVGGNWETLWPMHTHAHTVYSLDMTVKDVKTDKQYTKLLLHHSTEITTNICLQMFKVMSLHTLLYHWHDSTKWQSTACGMVYTVFPGECLRKKTSDFKLKCWESKNNLWMMSDRSNQM